jgi:hypothetical protein
MAQEAKMLAPNNKKGQRSSSTRALPSVSPSARVDRKVVIGKTIHAKYSERREAAMKYSSELIQTMRDALEAVMAIVPADQSVIGLKAAVAQCILQAAAHGQTSFDGLVASASGQLQTIISMLS